MDDVLRLFEGLTLSQVKKLRRRIIETLPQLRREVTREGYKFPANRRDGGEFIGGKNTSEEMPVLKKPF
jgi:hypothetical protein